MRKLVVIAIALFGLHTLEEITLHFWQTDVFSSTVANATGSSPETVYWIGQVILYLLLAFLLFAPKSGIKNWLYTLIGVLMLLEVVHVLVSLRSLHYEPGLATGITLVLYGIFFLMTTGKNRISHA